MVELVECRQTLAQANSACSPIRSGRAGHDDSAVDPANVD
jgi:hypothetical protein